MIWGLTWLSFRKEIPTEAQQFCFENGIQEKRQHLELIYREEKAMSREAQQKFAEG